MQVFKLNYLNFLASQEICQNDISLFFSSKHEQILNFELSIHFINFCITGS